jgi:transposase
MAVVGACLSGLPWNAARARKPYAPSDRDLAKMADRGSTTRGLAIVREEGLQVKGSIRVVGFDCAEDEHRAVLLDGNGEIEKRVGVANEREQVRESIAKLMLAIEPEATLVVVVESKRSHGRIVTDVAKQLGCEVWQVNTVALNHFRDLEGQPRKDDDWDAFLGARMVYLRMRGCRVTTQPTDEERALSRLTRTYSRITKDRTQQVSRLRAVLLELAPEMLHKSWEGPQPLSKAMLYLLERWPGFEGMERAQLRSIERILYKCRYGSKANRVAKLLRDMARRIELAAQERSAVTLEISLLVRQIRICYESSEQLYAEISKRVERHPVGQKLLEMHGFGPVLAGVLVSELLPVARAATESQCATYSGVTPLSRKSGKSLDNDRLAQGVNKRLLHALYTSSVVSIKHSAIDRAYYDKKVRDYAGHPKPHVAAFIALSRQRHRVVYKLMTTDARYDKETLIASHLERLEKQREVAA